MFNLDTTFEVIDFGITAQFISDHTNSEMGIMAKNEPKSHKHIVPNNRPSPEKRNGLKASDWMEKALLHIEDWA